MIPILFPSDATDFTSNGIGRLVDCLECSVTEERNGMYELELQYPVSGKWFRELSAGGVIAVIHDDHHDLQPFDIYKVSVPIDGIVTVNACHISYRLNNVIVQPYSADNAEETIAGVSENSVNANAFTFGTDMTSGVPFTLDGLRSARSVLLGEEGSILDTYGGGDFVFDGFSVQYLTSRGRDSGVTVRYGKNMRDLERELDLSGTFNAVAPFWSSDGTTVTLPEVIVRPTIPVDPVKPVVMDMCDWFDTVPTEEELRSAARAYLDRRQPWYPAESITVDFVALWQTPEYENVAEMQKVGLGDRVSVYWTAADIIAEKMRVERVVYNVLLERFDSLSLGAISKEHVATEGGDMDGSGGSTKAIDAYPVGSYYISAYSTSPEALFGGAWERVGNAALYFSDDSDALYNGLSVQRVTKDNITCNAGSTTGNVDFTVTRSGYTSLGVVGYYATGDCSTFANIVYCFLTASGNGTATVRMNARNMHSSTKGEWTFAAYVLWKKNAPSRPACYLWKRTA